MIRQKRFERIKESNIWAIRIDGYNYDKVVEIADWCKGKLTGTGNQMMWILASSFGGYMVASHGDWVVRLGVDSFVVYDNATFITLFKEIK